MVAIISLSELISEIGNIVQLKYSGSETWTTGDTITGVTSGATAFIDQVDSDNKTLWVIPTSSAFFIAMEMFAGITQTTPHLLLPCELTAFTTWEKTVKTFVEDYTNKIFGETETINIELTTEIGQRYETLPSNVVSLDSVTLNGTLLVEDTDFWFVQKTGLIDFGKELEFPSEPKNLLISYTDGSVTVPSSVKQAAKIMIVELWKMRNHNKEMKGASQLSFGGKSVTFATPVQDKELQGLLPMVSGLLKKKSRFILM